MCNDKDTGELLKSEVNCSHLFTVYESQDWNVAKYVDAETGNTITACGAKLPTSKNVTIHLHGTWRDNPKYGRQFSVDYFDVDLPSTKDGVVSYLGSLRVGIGKEKALRVYQKFGGSVWSVLERNPEQLLEIRGISKKIVSRLTKKLEETRIQRKIIERCGDAASVISPAMLNRMINHCAKREWDIMDVLEHHTYQLMEIRGFGFETVDKLARQMPDFKPDSIVRIIASLTFLFERAESRGHVCLPKDDLIKQMIALLNNQFPNAVNEEKCRQALNLAYKQETIKVTSGMVYTKRSYDQETGIVKDIQRLMTTHPHKISNIDDFIKQYEDENGVTLADSQKEAVRSSFRNQVNIITGGPGTGKTTTTKAVLYVHDQVFGSSSEPVLLAPTGRAARRMSEATGYPACTIHSAVGYTGVPELDERMSDTLEGNLFIIDESSMADQFITNILLEHIPDGARVIFVGDPDQLPSVGAGNVLHELIRSQVIPTVKLNVIFRQAQDNPIVENSIRMQKGETSLYFDGKRFVLFEQSDPAAIFKKACSLYVKSVQKFGLDNVILLNPYRHKTDLNVDRFNLNLQHLLNPPIDGEYTMRVHVIEFRRNDKVMQTRNTEIAMNGDIGYIQSIERCPDPDNPTEWTYIARIEFNGDGEIHEYTAEMMQDLDLAYCNTVHKAQGSEYLTVIMVASSVHEIMLQRNVVYTAITRSKQNVAIVGEEEALKRAIRNDKSETRYTLLGDRLHSKLSK